MANDERKTPRSLFTRINPELNFTMDVAATAAAPTQR
jgi:hypothetical protein